MSWKMVKLGDVLMYEQPTKYIVSSENYDSKNETPVLTAGKSFILGYTDEKEGIFSDVPVIIFDDFTTDIKYVDFPFKVKSSAMKILRTNTEIVDIRFMFYLMQTLNVSSSQHKRYWISKFANLEVSLPPIAIQKQIADILDKANELRKKDQKLKNKYDELSQAIFYDMFGDPVRNEKGWEMKTIEQLTLKNRHSIKRGPFGGALKKEIFVNDGYLVYEQFHALNNDFSFERYYINEDKYRELIAFKVEPGDIIISCSGIYLGKLAIVPANAKAGIINQALLKLTLDESIYRNELFVKVFSQENFKEKYFASERGAAIPNFPPISAFKEFKFITPPVELQNQYLRIVNNLKKQSNHIEMQIIKSNELFGALIQKVFNEGLMN